MEWETEFVGLPDERATDKVGNVRKTRARESIVGNCQRPHQDWCDGAGDGGHADQSEPHPEQRKDRELDTDARGHPRDHENTTLH